MNFLDAEGALNDGELWEERDEAVDRELGAGDRRAKKEIRSLEAEVIKWQVLVDQVNIIGFRFKGFLRDNLPF